MSHASEPHCVSEIELPAASRVYQPHRKLPKRSHTERQNRNEARPCSTASTGCSNGVSEMVAFQTGFTSESKRRTHGVLRPLCCSMSSMRGRRHHEFDQPKAAVVALPPYTAPQRYRLAPNS